MFDLTGLIVLIVEDEFLVACEMASVLSDYGAQVIGPAGSLKHAIEILDENRPLHVAILDINLAGEYVFPAADKLTERGVPFIFATGYGADMIPERHRGATRFEKPVPPEVLAQLISTAGLRPPT